MASEVHLYPNSLPPPPRVGGFVRKVVQGLNALQSQKITKRNTPKLGKNGKKKKKTAKNIGPKRSKDPKYLNVITERAAPKGKSATSEKEEKRSRKNERLHE